MPPGWAHVSPLQDLGEQQRKGEVTHAPQDEEVRAEQQQGLRSASRVTPAPTPARPGTRAALVPGRQTSLASVSRGLMLLTAFSSQHGGGSHGCAHPLEPPPPVGSPVSPPACPGHTQAGLGRTSGLAPARALAMQPPFPSAGPPKQAASPHGAPGAGAGSAPGSESPTESSQHYGWVQTGRRARSPSQPGVSLALAGPTGQGRGRGERGAFWTPSPALHKQGGASPAPAGLAHRAGPVRVTRPCTWAGGSGGARGGVGQALERGPRR